MPINIEGIEISLDLNLAVEVGEYFQLDNNQMKGIIAEVQKVVKTWRKKAVKLKIPRGEQDRMEGAFQG